MWAIATLFHKRVYVSLHPEVPHYECVRVGLAMKRCLNPMITCGEYMNTSLLIRPSIRSRYFLLSFCYISLFAVFSLRLQNIKNVDPVAELCVCCRHLSSLTHIRLKHRRPAAVENPQGMRGLKSNECFFLFVFRSPSHFSVRVSTLE